MSTAVETALVPKYKKPPGVLPISGCSSRCELFPRICWLMTGQGEYMRQMLGTHCPDCLVMKPHVHWNRMNKIERMRKPRVFSGHFCETSDLSGEDIEQLQSIMERHPSHLFQVFSHQKDFFDYYPKWSKNVWCCQTFTSGEIGFPAELECGVRVAYCEPVMGELAIREDSDILLPTDVCGEMPFGPRVIARAGIHHALSNQHGAISVIAENGELLGIKPGEFLRLAPPQWLVIGLLNHHDYAKFGITLEMLAVWIKDLMRDARALGIPIFTKNVKDSRWAQMGIVPVQEWPK